MTVDSSAIVAILRGEPETLQFTQLIDSAPVKLMSTASVLEASMVLDGRAGSSQYHIDAYLQKIGIEIRAFDTEQLALARMAFRRFGKGRHPAKLNFGDCISYALSQITGEPLLFKGTDFLLTDVVPAILPS